MVLAETFNPGGMSSATDFASEGEHWLYCAMKMREENEPEFATVLATAGSECRMAAEGFGLKCDNFLGIRAFVYLFVSLVFRMFLCWIV